ncbi:hypothetical protein DFH27DRAFT_387935 [Peziza echinospora]|nr:hypothetical protein DFH27DRAFT_387935 [Peziza echinospora]
MSSRRKPSARSDEGENGPDAEGFYHTIVVRCPSAHFRPSGRPAPAATPPVLAGGIKRKAVAEPQATLQPPTALRSARKRAKLTAAVTAAGFRVCGPSGKDYTAVREDSKYAVPDALMPVPVDLLHQKQPSRLDTAVAWSNRSSKPVEELEEEWGWLPRVYHSVGVETPGTISCIRGVPRQIIIPTVTPARPGEQEDEEMLDCIVVAATAPHQACKGKLSFENRPFVPSSPPMLPTPINSRGTTPAFSTCWSTDDESILLSPTTSSRPIGYYNDDKPVTRQKLALAEDPAQNHDSTNSIVDAAKALEAMDAMLLLRAGFSK